MKEERGSNPKENNDYYIHNAKGLAIIHFSHIYSTTNALEFHHPLDYHIHLLSFHDESKNYCGAILLDTNDVMTRPLKENENPQEVVEHLFLDLSRLFIDKINSLMKKDDIDECMRILFQKSDTSLWEFFNEVKQRTYLRDIKRFSNFVQNKKFGLIPENKVLTKDSPIDTYNNVDIWVTEDRILKHAAKQL